MVKISSRKIDLRTRLGDGRVEARGRVEAYAGRDQNTYLFFIASPCQNGTKDANTELQEGHNHPDEKNKPPPGAASSMKTINAIIAAIVDHRPVTKMAYVALVTICDLDDGPRIDVIIYRDAITPATETYRLPQMGIYGIIRDKAIKPRGA
ncbi:hypothetical protein O1611_g5633 [Lasiodiplodia mahajangana]|uniref:Uncharacterized protein n=1 Tax=Lasiodiplodia mahajangana TaxID=1108764 RepID=A0ACC2JLC8_9PEZI|nr:hypothetical protein O1611_g5633 [Lasiodiplodia mahajangana]